MDRAQNINPRMLSWARETAGFSIEEAAAKLGFSNSKRVTATEKLQAFEEGHESRPAFSF